MTVLITEARVVPLFGTEGPKSLPISLVHARCVLSLLAIQRIRTYVLFRFVVRARPASHYFDDRSVVDPLRPVRSLWLMRPLASVAVRQ